MSIAKEKSLKPAAQNMRVAPQANPQQAQSVSTEQTAERFCEEMIQNLKRNVPEDKRRTDAESRATLAELAAYDQEIGI
jgi:6-pyruvoyl-tetrahydropterin synthase